MLALDKETFSYWVTQPHNLTLTDFTQLQESLLTFPYCQALHTLTAKAASIHQKSQTVSYVRRAAAHALSRNSLRKLIDNEFQWSDNLLMKLNELSAKHVPIPDDYQQESYALFKAKAGLGNSYPKLTLLRLPDRNANGQQTESVTIPTPEDQTIAETNLQHDLAQIAPTAPEQPALSSADLERQRQLDLIDSFIRKEPRISPGRSKLAEPVELEDLTKRNKPIGGGMVTESFAKILLRQGKTDKAREIYQQLMVKSPDKKAYFAAKISELEETTDKASD